MKFEELELESGFTLNGEDAVVYLDWVAMQHTEQVMAGMEATECMDAIFEDLYEMKKDIKQKNYYCVRFFECPMSASGINYEPLIPKSDLNFAITEMAKWIANNLDYPVPLIFRDEKLQKRLDNEVKTLKGEEDE